MECTPGQKKVAVKERWPIVEDRLSKKCPPCGSFFFVNFCLILLSYSPSCFRHTNILVLEKNYSTLSGWEQCILSVTPVQKVQNRCKLHIVILDYDWLEYDGKFYKLTISGKMRRKILCRNFEKSFLECLECTSSTRIFQVFIINKSGLCNISFFGKTHPCKLIPNWTRNRMITYTYNVLLWLLKSVNWKRAWSWYMPRAVKNSGVLSWSP